MWVARKFVEKCFGSFSKSNALTVDSFKSTGSGVVRKGFYKETTWNGTGQEGNCKEISYDTDKNGKIVSETRKYMVPADGAGQKEDSRLNKHLNAFGNAFDNAFDNAFRAHNNAFRVHDNAFRAHDKMFADRPRVSWFLNSPISLSPLSRCKKNVARDSLDIKNSEGVDNSSWSDTDSTVSEANSWCSKGSDCSKLSENLYNGNKESVDSTPKRVRFAAADNVNVYDREDDREDERGGDVSGPSHSVASGGSSAISNGAASRRGMTTYPFDIDKELCLYGY